jgi:arylsulfatase A-like enzyme
MYHESGSEKIDMALDYKGDPSWFAASDELAYYHNRYMGEVSYLDEQLGRMFDHLRALGIFDSMLIVVVADHGEAFGEHGVYCEHRGLHDPVTRVPLFIKAPAQRVGGVVDAIVSTVDIYPTILDYLGRQPSGRVRGRSLRPLADAARAGERVPAKASDRAWSEHGGMLQLSARTPSHRLLVGFGDHDFFPRFAISQGNVELYPVAPQSGEGANLAAEMPELLDTLEREAEAFRADRFELSADEIEDEQYIERLRRLGYAE